MGGQAVIVGLAIVSSIVLNRALRAEGRGYVAMVILWPTLIANLAVAGWGPATATQVGRDQVGARQSWTASQLVAVAASLVAVPAAWFLIPFLLAEHSECLFAARWYIAFIPLACLSGLSLSVIEGLGRFDLSSQVRVGNVVLILMMLAVALALGWLTPDSYVLIVLITALLMTSRTMQLAWRHTSGSWRPRCGEMQGYAARAAPLTWATLAQQRVDQVLIAALAPPNAAAFGAYVAGTAVGGLLSPVSAGLSLVLVPEAARHSGENAVALYARMARMLVLAVLLGGVPLALFAPWVLACAYGWEFAGGDMALRVSILNVLLGGLLSMGLSTLQGLNRPGAATLVGLCALAVSTGAATLLLPMVGFVGAACGQALGMLAGVTLLRLVLGGQGLNLGAFVPGTEDVERLRGVIRQFYVHLLKKLDSVAAARDRSGAEPDGPLDPPSRTQP